MANITAVQTLVDGPRNVVVLCTGILDTSNVSVTTVIDVSALAGAPSDLLIDKIWWSVASPLQLLLWWDADTDDVFATLVDYGYLDYTCFGGLKNPRSTGWNGDVRLSTVGYGSGTVAYSAVIHATKRGAA